MTFEEFKAQKSSELPVKTISTMHPSRYLFFSKEKSVYPLRYNRSTEKLQIKSSLYRRATRKNLRYRRSNNNV